MAQTTAQRATDETDEIEGLTRGDGPDIELTATGGDFVVLPEDIYVVEFLRFEDGPEGQFGPSLRLVYGVAEGAHAGEVLDELASLKSGPKAKLRQRAEALRGRPYETGEADPPGAPLREAGPGGGQDPQDRPGRRVQPHRQPHAAARAAERPAGAAGGAAPAAASRRRF